MTSGGSFGWLAYQEQVYESICPKKILVSLNMWDKQPQSLKTLFSRPILVNSDTADFKKPFAGLLRMSADAELLVMSVRSGHLHNVSYPSLTFTLFAS